MQVSAWIMLIFGCAVLYGGLGACLIIARSNQVKKKGSLTNEEPSE
jgi:hypothetical protein